MKTVSWRMGLWIGLAALPLGLAAAEAPSLPEPRGGDTIGWHVVRPGEILEEITGHYLGSTALWPENWRLNPDIADPNFLRIGQRIRVILHRKLPQRTAQIHKIERSVEQKPEPSPWIPAKVGDLLRERDGVRTHRRSSAEMLFDDDSRLLIGEQSVVFLRELGSTLRGVSRQSIEIVDGQADLEARPARKRSTHIEILVGDARARPRAEPGGLAQTRARRNSAETAQVMVYGGSSEVQAAGATVSVPKGMGTSIPRGKPPKPPEKLLPAPRPLQPAAGSAWNYANPPFNWQAVPGAAAYDVEVCRDEACTQLLDREAGLADPRWAPEALPRGKLFWRVRAGGRSGLDGFPSKPLAFEILSASPDLSPPIIAVALTGLGRVLEDGTVLLGSGAGLGVHVHDDAAGVEELRLRWDGGVWQKIRPGATIAPPSVAGKHTLQLEATDRLGKVSPILIVPVVSDLVAPELPQLRPDREP